MHSKNSVIFNIKRLALCKINLIIVLFLYACASTHSIYKDRIETKNIPPTQRPYTYMGRLYYPMPSADGYIEEGYASWYGGEFHGNNTACGEIYDMHELTAAHKTLPMHTYVKVTNLENGLETFVRINDRGPFLKGRIIDLSHAAAIQVGMVENGVAYVRVEAMGMAAGNGKDNEYDKVLDKVADYTAYTTGTFWIQVGAFIDLENAERLLNKLKESYDMVEIKIHQRENIPFYCVQVFASNDLSEAYGLKDRFEQQGFTGAFVVAD